MCNGVLAKVFGYTETYALVLFAGGSNDFGFVVKGGQLVLLLDLDVEVIFNRQH